MHDHENIVRLHTEKFVRGGSLFCFRDLAEYGSRIMGCRYICLARTQRQQNARAS
jgi:hypothetical protein